MGLDRTIAWSGPAPTVAELAAGAGSPLQMRMIDGELAFPDEEPPADWRELRMACSAGMITLRRSATDMTLVVWGNASVELLEVVERLATALSAAQIQMKPNF